MKGETMTNFDAIDPMIEIIANESASLEEYARRVDAYVATLASKPTQREIIAAWCTCKSVQLDASKHGTRIRSELRAAATKRNAQRDALWGSLCKSISDDDGEER